VAFLGLSLAFRVTFFVVFCGFFMVIFSAKAFNQTRAWGRQAVRSGATPEIQPPISKTSSKNRHCLKQSRTRRCLVSRLISLL
jgi:hypothetical protein